MWPLLPLPLDALPELSQRASVVSPGEAVEVRQDQQRQVKRFDGLEVTYDSLYHDFETKRQVFSGRVTARYGETLLEAEELSLDEEARKGEAKGKVVVSDPEGGLKADSVVFYWRRQSDPPPAPDDLLGEAKNAVIRAGNVHLSAQSMKILGNRYELTEAEGALTQSKTPEWKFLAKEATVFPGRYGVARRVRFEALGMRVGTLPLYRFNLNPRVDSKLTLPSYSIDEDGRLGLSWSALRPIGDKAAASAYWSSFPRSFPGWGVTFTLSTLSSDQTRARIAVSGDLGERFSGGYLNNVNIGSPDQEAGELRQPRSTFQAATVWNSGVSGRNEGGALISKPLDLVYEVGGPARQAGWVSTSRLQLITSQAREPFRTRLTQYGVLSLPPLKLSDQLSFRSRLDGFGTVSEKTLFGFVRGEAGFIWNPDERLRIGAAYVLGVEAGSPDFFWDRLYSRQALHWRVDANWGPVSISYLWKYDFNRGTIYDKEYIASYVAGAFEPFIEYRKFPSSYQWGIRFRMDNVLQRLTARAPKR